MIMLRIAKFNKIKNYLLKTQRLDKAKARFARSRNLRSMITHVRNSKWMGYKTLLAKILNTKKTKDLIKKYAKSSGLIRSNHRRINHYIKRRFMRKFKMITNTPLVVWNKKLPMYCFRNFSHQTKTFDTKYSFYLVNKLHVIKISKHHYGSVLMIDDNTLKLFNKGYAKMPTSAGWPNKVSPAPLGEKAVVRFYTQTLPLSVVSIQEGFENRPVIKKRVRDHKNSLVRFKILTEKRAYMRSMIKRRYRWFFRSNLHKFKLFKKFFKRSLKRYRKISKNRLFLGKLRSHFPKLTGFTEKGLMSLWLPFRRNYNQYWLGTNAVKRFSQSLLLIPSNFLIFLKFSPSLAASKHMVQCGAVTINGLTATTLTPFVPGDIMQFSTGIWKLTRNLFDYQKWEKIKMSKITHLKFLQVDWSCLMFMMIYWPEDYRLKAPSFISERWVRYFIRHFPTKVARFRKAHANWNFYKRIISKK